MRAISLLFFIFATSAAGACPEEKARALVDEEALALGGPVEDFWRTDDGSYQGRVSAMISYWNGQTARATFLVEVNRSCRVTVWLRSAD